MISLLLIFLASVAFIDHYCSSFDEIIYSENISSCSSHAKKAILGEALIFQISFYKKLEIDSSVFAKWI